jgi:hypothetical protein
MSEDAVLAAARKSDNNNQEKQVMRQQIKSKPTVLIVINFIVSVVLTRNITLCNK